MRWTLVIMGLALAAGITAYALHDQREGLPPHAARVLRDAESFELLTLDPGIGWMWSPEEHVNPDPAKFHHVIVLGREPVRDTSLRMQLIDALDRDGGGVIGRVVLRAHQEQVRTALAARLGLMILFRNGRMVSSN